MICQRPANKARGMLWEFVGGKVEPGETKEQALIRECQEELAITLSAGDVFMDVVHEYPDLTVHLTLLNATIAKGTPRKLEHNDISWITVGEISQYNFCPADEEILKKLYKTHEWSPNEALELLRRENHSGIYQVLIRNRKQFQSTDACPRLYEELCSCKNNRLVYIGKADGKGMLRIRLRQELLGMGRGTFFRSIGAVIGEAPRRARTPGEVTNYVFEGTAKERIVEFIQTNLVVTLEPLNENIEMEEQKRIKLYHPPLNLKNNEYQWQYLIEQRERCRNIAGGKDFDHTISQARP